VKEVEIFICSVVWMFMTYVLQNAQQLLIRTLRALKMRNGIE